MRPDSEAARAWDVYSKGGHDAYHHPIQALACWCAHIMLDNSYVNQNLCTMIM